jgi:hypothetical protein
MSQLFEKGQRRPANAGRRKGTPNRATAAIREAAQHHGPSVLERLVKLTTHRDGRIAVKACEIFLAYAYGKPTEHIELAGEEGGQVSPKITIYMPDNQRDGGRDLKTLKP